MSSGSRWVGADDNDPAARLPIGRRRIEAASRLSAMLPQRDGPAAPPTAPPALLPQRDHEMARLRAKLMSPEAAWSDLIERLNYAVVQGGKPALSTLGKQVDYSKATLSKVLTGKAMPSWVLVRRLGEHFQIPPQVLQEWYTLWTAANMHNRKTTPVRGRAPVPALATGTADANAAAGYKCPKCGSWVVDTALHSDWHMEIEPARHTPPPGWHAAPGEMGLLRTALGDQRP